MTSVSIEDIRDAQETIRPHVHRTPLWHNGTLSQLTGTDLWLKAENLQRTGSFKPRGIVNAVLSLTEEERAQGVITFSAGNTGQALAYAGRMVGAAVTVVMPDSAPRAKVEAITGYGAEPVLVPAAELLEAIEREQQARGQVLIHPWGNVPMLAGHGTVGLEILEDLPEVEVVVVPVGGGGLIAGVASALKALRPDVSVIGVEPRRADVVTRSLAAGEPVRLLPTSIADGLNAPSASPISLDIIRQLVDGIVLMDDAEILRAVGLILQRMKLLVEPAGATAVAALLAGVVPGAMGKTAVAILSGGNVDIKRLADLLAATP